MWIGFAENDEEKSVRPVAQAGYESGYLDTLKITWENDQYGQGPTGRAIRTGKASFASHILTDPRFSPWRESAIRYGYQSSIAVPLKAHGKPFGALNIYSNKPDAFAPNEISLVEDLADDIVRGVLSIRESVKRKQAENELMAYRDHLEDTVEKRTTELEKEIAERIQTEKELQKAKETAEAANRAKSVFLANMSHELRTPLNSVLGFSQLMLRDQRLVTGQKENLAKINRSGEHLLSLINDVLEISKIEVGRIALHETSFDLFALLDDLEMMFRVRTDAKGLRLEFTKETGVPRYLNGDLGKVRQCLINLLGNSVKFTDQGSISLQVAVQGSTAADTIELVFEVEDSGRGIAGEELEKIFQPFEQIVKSGDAGEGTGLGLTITREYARLMGGEVTVRSRPGAGSTFSLMVPVAPGREEDVETMKSPRTVIGLAPGQAAPKILVVDDNPDNLTLLTTLLHSVGFTIREAVNGKEAIHEFKEWSPACVLMDMKMPVMDGYEATRRIKRLPRGKDTPVIAVTASAFTEDRQNILDTGADGVIEKPYQEEEIFRRIGSLISVQYQYTDSPAVPAGGAVDGKVAPEDLVSLPEELLQEILEAAKELDRKLCLTRIDKVRALNNQAAAAMTEMAKNYNFDRLIDIIKLALERQDVSG